MSEKNKDLGDELIQLWSRRQLLRSFGGTMMWSFLREVSISIPQSVNLEVKIGQMLLAGFRGLQVNLTHPVIDDIKNNHLGGVILFDYDLPTKKAERNIKSDQQVKKLTEDLQSFSTLLPLFVAIDYEGGRINRLNEQYGFPPTRSHQELGESHDIKQTYRQASKMAHTLSQLGINLNFSPVVDVKVNPNNPVIAKRQRSFSANPQVVSQHALEFIKAHHEYGVLCVPKHFPGHGSSNTDSHFGMVDVTKTWSPRELEPYAYLIREGLADAIMTAHVFNARLDSQYPATLSKATITELLRGHSTMATSFIKELGQKIPLNYDGVIFSDDIRMKAITSKYDFKMALQKAIDAGIDILIIGNNTEVFEENLVTRTVAMIKQLIEEGQLSEARIDESYQRILRMKNKLR